MPKGMRIALLTSMMTLSVPAMAQGAQTEAAGAPRFVVVLDAAHGGDDTGARLGSQLEKNYTLALSVRLRSLLTARGITVVTTREADVAVDAARREEIANHAGASACLSLHAAVNNAKTGTAVHIFVSSLPAQQGAQFVPWNSAQAAWVTKSVALAGALNSTLTHANMTVTLGRTALPVVDSMACPAVAIEIAPEQEASPQSGGGRNDFADQVQVANDLVSALVEWRAEQSGGR